MCHDSLKHTETSSKLCISWDVVHVAPASWWPSTKLWQAICGHSDDQDSRLESPNMGGTGIWRVKIVILPLTYWGQVTHICVSKLTTIGSDNGLSPGRRQIIIWTNTGILLIGPLRTNFDGILIDSHTLKSIWKCCLENGGHFVSPSMCLRQDFCTMTAVSDDLSVSIWLR